MMGLFKFVAASLIICMVVYSVVGVFTLININNTLVDIETTLLNIESGLDNGASN